MAQNLHTVDLRSLSDNKHQHQVWGSGIYFVPKCLKRSVDLFSFKHAGIDRLAKSCRSNTRVLDFGTGNGNFSVYFSTTCQSTIIAADWSFEALKQAKKKFSSYRIFPVCADLHALPFKDSSFAAFFTIDVFGHLYDPRKALDSLYCVLQPGARGFFHSECADYQKRWPDSMLITKNGRDIPAEIDGHVSLFTTDTIKSSLSSKFNIIKSFSPAGYSGWLTGYPEKYTAAFSQTGEKTLFTLTSLFSKIKSYFPGKILLRTFNYLTNGIELLLNLQGGGSLFADVIKPVSEKKTSELSIDIIIPTYQRDVQLNHLVEQLLTQCRNDDSIIVITQDKALKITSPSPKIHLIYNTPVNLPQARNRGIQSGTNDIILFLDDDTIISEGLLEQHRKAYKNAAINCIAGSVNDPRFTQSTTSPSRFDVHTGELIQNFLYPKASQSISFMGAHFSFRRSVLHNVGGFDPAFTGNAYWEDIDFSFRLQKKGHSIHYEPDIRVIHAISDNGGCRSRTKASFCYSYFTNSTYFSLKYIPGKHARTWLSYWKYRLEFETRSTTHPALLKHDPILLTVSLCGVIMGITRFFLKGKRVGLPTSVIHKTISESA
jgi:GT2 family glycosyltransferase/SAM-dependent methyltransferase